MTFKLKIVFITCIPILVIFLSAVISQFIALHYIQGHIQEFADQLFDQQIAFSRKQTSSISYQMFNQLSRIPQYLSAMNRFYSKTLTGKIPLNPNHRNSYLSMEALFLNKEDPELTQIFKNNPYSITSWYHKNYTKLSQLNQEGQEIMTNFQRMTPLMRAIDYENRQVVEGIRKLEFKDIFFGLQQQGFMISKAVNTTHVSFKVDPECGGGVYNFDPRCRYWYKLSSKLKSLNVNKPDLIFSEAEPQMAQNICQKLLNYDEASQQNTLHHVMCINFPLKKTQEYFHNFAKSIKQSYMIEPISQVIIFNSNKPLNKVKSETLHEVEFKFLESQQDAQYFNDTLKKYYNNFVVQEAQSIKEISFTDLHETLTTFSYNRNGTKYMVILNPIYILDKIPIFDGIKNIPQTRTYQMCLTHLQINMISDEEMRQYSNSVINDNQKITIVVFISYLTLGVISIPISIYYAICISNLLTAPINHLTTILQKLQQENDKPHELLNIFDDQSIKAEDIFLSQETRQLYESFISVFQILVYTSENFFLDNETQTLLKLNKNIEFFKQFQNIYAVGITHNHIGSIFVSQGHYFQAMEHFSQSILYARYEIEKFCKSNPDSQCVQILQLYCIDDSFQIEKLELESKDASLFKTDSKSKKSSNQENPRLKIEGKNLSISKSKQSSKGQIIFDQSDFTRQKLFSKLKTINQLDSRVDISSKDEEDDEDDGDEGESYHNYGRNDQNDNRKDSSTYSKMLMMKSRQLNEEDEYHQNKLNRSNNSTFQKQFNFDDIHLSEQSIQLLSSLYYRKKNYIVTLLAFQENVDEQVMKKGYTIQYNFWYEIKDLFKELLIISNYLPFEESNKIEILSQIAKCQFKLNNFKLSQKILNDCQIILENLKNSKTNNKSDQLQLQIKKPIMQQSIKFLKQSQIQYHQQMQIRSKQTLSNFTTNREMQTTNMTSAAIKSLQSTNLTSSKSPVVQQQQYPLKFNQKENKQKQKTVTMQIQSISLIPEDLPSSPLMQQQISEGSSPQKLLNPYSNQKSHNRAQRAEQLDLTNQKSSEQYYKVNAREDHIQLKQKQSSPSEERYQQEINANNNDSNSSNIFMAKKKEYLNIESDVEEGENSRYKQHSFVNQLAATTKRYTNQNNLTITNNKSQQINNSSVNNITNINNQNYSFFQNSMLNSVNQSNINLVSNHTNIHSYQNNSNTNLNLVQGNKSNNNSNENYSPQLNKNKDEESENKQEDSFKKKIGQFRKIFKNEFDKFEIKESEEETIQDMKKRLEQIIENQSLYLLSHSLEQLEFLINFTSAEFSMQKEDYFPAAQMLTALLENNKSFMKHQPYRIIHKLSRIFEKFNIFSSELNQIHKKFNPQISQKVGIIMSKVENRKSQMEQMNLLNNLLNNTLYQLNDQIGIFYISEQEKSEITSYMNLTRVRQIKELSPQIIQDVHKAITNSSVPLILQNLQNTTNMDCSDDQSLKNRNQSINPSKYYTKSHLQLPSNLDSIENDEIINLQIDDNNNMKSYSNIKSQYEVNFQSEQETPVKSSEGIQNITEGAPKMDCQSNSKNQNMRNEKQQQQDTYLPKVKKQRKSILGNYNSKRNMISNIDLIHEEMEQSKNDQQQSLQSNQLQIEKLRNNLQQNQPQFFEINKGEQIHKKMSVIEGDDYSFYNQSQLSGSDEIQQSFVTLNNDSTDKNTLFHQSIRKTIIMLFQSDINFTSLTNHTLLQQYYQYGGKCEEEQFERRHHHSHQYHSQKYIIYCTNQIEVINDHLFQKLSSFLYHYNIQILISSSMKTNNFLETTPNLTYQFNNKDIIKVFYSTKTIANFLKSQRDSINKYTYPIIIQHF